VAVQGLEDRVAEPEPDGDGVRAEQNCSHSHRHQVGENMLDGVAVDGHHCNRRSPLVVLLVNVFVQPFIVHKSVTNKNGV